MRSSQRHCLFPDSRRLCKLLHIIKDRTCFGGFAPDDYRYDIWPDLGRSFMRVNMTFEPAMDTAIGLEDTDFDVMAFVQATLQLATGMQLSVNLHIYNTSGELLSDASSIITLGQLRLNVLKAFEASKPPPVDLFAVCPQVWVSGLGSVVRVIEAPLNYIAMYLDSGERVALTKVRLGRLPIPKEDSTAYYEYTYLEWHCSEYIRNRK